MIHTLTGNLLAERTLEFADWAPGKTQRAQAASFQVGGKGINVSRMLNRLDTANTALAFVGGAPGTECAEWLARSGLAHRLFESVAPTRTGLVVRAPGKKETTFLGPDVIPDAAAILACSRYLEEQPASGALAFCGSFPGWDTPSLAPLRELLARWAGARRVFVDTYGPPLSFFVHLPVDLVKINRDEFDLLFTPAERTGALSARLLAARARWPARRWIITDGPREVWCLDTEGPPQSFPPPPVQEVSATGSGDVFFACVLHAQLVRGFTLAAALEFALPYGAANAASAGIADFDLNKLPPGRSVSSP
jgi:1-phosphofructokinase